MRTEELDNGIGGWTKRHDLDHVLNVLDNVEVPSGKIYSIAELRCG